MRRALFNMVKQNPLKDSVVGKIQPASWDNQIRAEILFGQRLNKIYSALVNKAIYPKMILF